MDRVSRSWVGCAHVRWMCVEKPKSSANDLWEKNNFYVEIRRFHSRNLNYVWVCRILGCRCGWLWTEGFSLLKLLNFVSAPFSSRPEQTADFTFAIKSLIEGRHLLSRDLCAIKQQRILCARLSPWKAEKLKDKKNAAKKCAMRRRKKSINK